MSTTDSDLVSTVCVHVKFKWATLRWSIGPYGTTPVIKHPMTTQRIFICLHEANTKSL